jgi:hypothetical protein
MNDTAMQSPATHEQQDVELTEDELEHAVGGLARAWTEPGERMVRMPLPPAGPTLVAL